MGDARPGALEPPSRAVIKSWGLRGSKNEVQMRGGFEAWAQVPGGGGVWGGAGRGAWNPLPPKCTRGWDRACSRVRTLGDEALGHAGKGRSAGAGGVRLRGHRAPANTPRSLALRSAVYEFGFFFFFFGLLVSGQSCSDLTTGRLEEGGGKQETDYFGVGRGKN